MVLNELVGSHYYLSPELIKSQFDRKCDAWSLGVLMHYMLSKTLPY